MKTTHPTRRRSASTCTRFILLAMTVSILAGTSVNSQPTGLEETASLELNKDGRTLSVEAYIPRRLTRFELRIESDRNEPVTRVTTLSPHEPDPESRIRRYSDRESEIWYPVVDVALEPGMEAVCVFSEEPAGEYVFGSPYYRESLPLERQIVVPTHKLEYWENSLTVPSREYEIERFYLRRTYPVLLREFRHRFELLSEDWNGRVSIWAEGPGGKVKLASSSVSNEGREWWAEEVEGMKGSGMSRERLIAALDLLIKDGLRRQNHNPGSPMQGSLFLFYDLEARLHRTPYWTWGGSQWVKMVTDAVKIPEIQERHDVGHLIRAARRVGDIYLKYQVREEGHPSIGSYLVIWSRGHRGYTKWVGTSDSGVIVRWALVPLFQATGDSAYLESAEYWCRKKIEIDTFRILPHFYRYDEDRFNPGILDETGWDPEGHAALYEVTGKEIYRESGKAFMDKRMTVFQREDGLWQRSHNWQTGHTQETARMVRGLGWAMEGLLAMNRMYPDTIYLEYARRMADQLAAHQLKDGSWSFVFDEPVERWGVTEKGTALWSLLFYQLHDATGEERYLETARKALHWCLENQYTGPDPEAIGGLVGRTNASMVGIRYFYDATCAYATGFFGMAIVEELKRMNR